MTRFDLIMKEATGHTLPEWEEMAFLDSTIEITPEKLQKALDRAFKLGQQSSHSS